MRGRRSRRWPFPENWAKLRRLDKEELPIVTKSESASDKEAPDEAADIGELDDIPGGLAWSRLRPFLKDRPVRVAGPPASLRPLRTSDCGAPRNIPGLRWVLHPA